jgi:hypothetical protein
MDIRPKSFIKRVFDFALAELDRRAQQGAQPSSSTSQSQPQAEAAGAAARAPAEQKPEVAAEVEPRHRTPPGGLEVARNERGAVRVRWALGSAELQRSSALIDDGAVLCLRLVSFAASRDHVVREVQDRPSIATQGECEIARTEGRTVVSLGLRSGGRFVSIAHHIV